MRKEKIIVIATWLLFIMLVYTRLTARALNPLWTDELNEISHLKSLDYLIYEYLPNIPSGVLGHYLLLLPLNTFFPGNKFILGLPGLACNILVFLLIPKVISSFHINNKKELTISSLVARIGLVFDPRLSFQSVEVRPYSLLPLLWVLSVFLVDKIISYDNQVNKQLKMINIILVIIAAIFLWFWHIYTIIMFMSIYFFFIFKSKLDKNLIGKHSRSLMVVFISIVFFVPVWIYFSGNVTNSYLNTFDFLENISKFIDTTLNRGYIKGVSLLNSLFLFTLLSFFGVIIWTVLLKTSKYILLFWKMFIFLVIFPILSIFTLDVISHYWFLYRQFAWAAVPFYIAIGILISGFKSKMLK